MHAEGLENKLNTLSPRLKEAKFKLKPAQIKLTLVHTVFCSHVVSLYFDCCLSTYVKVQLGRTMVLYRSDEHRKLELYRSIYYEKKELDGKLQVLLKEAPANYERVYNACDS
jgi:hypothetical protein